MGRTSLVNLLKGVSLDTRCIVVLIPCIQRTVVFDTSYTGRDYFPLAAFSFVSHFYIYLAIYPTRL